MTPLAPPARSLLAELVACADADPCRCTRMPPGYRWRDAWAAAREYLNNDARVADGPAALIARLREWADPGLIKHVGNILLNGRRLEADISDAIAALEAMARIPREPTKEMQNAGVDAMFDRQGDLKWKELALIVRKGWRAMYDAAPRVEGEAE